MNTEHVGDTFKQLAEQLSKDVADDTTIEQIICIVAKSDGSFHTVLDINVPMPINMAMLQGAAVQIFQQKKMRAAANDAN